MTMNRRRFIQIAAGGTAAALSALVKPGSGAASVVWRGVALGASAKIILDGDPAGSGAVISNMVGEIARLEKLFSLYRRDSAISLLNRTGRLDNPDPDFLALLSMSDRIHGASNGAFDPTIQSAWAALAAD